MSWQTVTPQTFELGESPFWHPDEQALYWVDIPGRSVYRQVGAGSASSGPAERWAMPSEPGSIAPARDRLGQPCGLVIALRDGIYRAPVWGGGLTLLVSGAHDSATTRFNDGKADPLGRFWAGTMYEPRTYPLAALFCVGGRAAPELTRMTGNATIANGLAWSPDAATLYWADTPSHAIRAWDWNASTNTLSRERLFKQWPVKPAANASASTAYDGRPDGAAVSANGHYFAAMYEGGQLMELSPQGDVLAHWPVPARCPTMACFGGPDLKTLFVTTARQHRPADELLRWPDSGCVFSKRVDAPGLPVNFFRDDCWPA